MPKYPFSPALLDALPEPIAELFRGLELTLLEEICSRLKIADNLNEVTVQDIRALRSHGIDLKEIEKAIRDVTGVSQQRLDELFDQVVERNQAYYTEVIDLAGVTKPEVIVGAAEIDAIRRQTMNEFRNITRSIGFVIRKGARVTMLPAAETYQHILDSAELQIQSGAVSYQQAIESAVKQLADSGLRTVTYEKDGKTRTEHIDVAARRAILTGVRQTCSKYTEQSAEYLDTPYYEMSAHQGARDIDGPNGWENHKAWQGKVYYGGRPGEKDPLGKYPNLHDATGYGEVNGAEGANCKHWRNVWIEGVSERTYTDEQLANIDPPPFEFEGRTYTAYQATQKQRQIEDTVRKLKSEREASKAAGLNEDATAVNVKIRRLNSKYKEFSEAAGLPMQKERMKVLYTDDASIAKAAALKERRAKEAPIREAIKHGKSKKLLELAKK